MSGLIPLASRIAERSVLMIAELLETKFVREAAAQMLQLLEQEKIAQEQGDPDARDRGLESLVGSRSVATARRTEKAPTAMRLFALGFLLCLIALDRSAIHQL